ncbi:MAG: Ig-like domain-containing protein [Pseudomonadota bacterium]|nr:Ig-like domain-containing protein [Pseudomonadota bacterium]
MPGPPKRRGGAGGAMTMGEAFGQRLDGTDGDDSLVGAGDWDVLRGFAGDDLLAPLGRGGEAHGGDGDDTLVAGGTHRDALFGDAGDDLFRIESGLADMFGGDGDDVLEASGGSGLFAGGEGIDTALLAGARADWTISADGRIAQSAVLGASFHLASVEILRFDDAALLVAATWPGATVTGDYQARDPAVGTDRDDLFLLGDGDDAVYGGGGDDQVFAGGGDDVIDLVSAWGGGHWVEAGDGNDVIDAAGWDAHLFGGAGDDLFRLGYGFNTVDGGPGEDRVIYAARREEARIDFAAPGVVILSRPGDGIAPHDRARDVLTGIERIEFSDGVAVDLAAGPVPDAESFAGTEGETLAIPVAALLDGDVSAWGEAAFLGVEGAEGGTVSVSGDTVLFTPDPGVFGAAAFVYRVGDASGEARQRVTLDLASDNAAPAARDDAFAAGARGGVSGDLLADNGAGADADPDGDALRLAWIEGAAAAGAAGANGAASVLRLPSGALVRFGADGGFVYDPDGAFDGLAPGETATDGFDYAVMDPEGAFDLGHAALTVTGEAAPPAVSLFGGAGAQRLRGGAGDDALRGGAGRDVIRAGDGDDLLAGGRGRDRLDGGRGDDVIRGGAGADLLRFRAGDGADRIVGFDPDHDRARFGRGVDGREALEILDTDGGALVRYAGGEALFVGLHAHDLDAQTLLA